MSAQFQQQMQQSSRSPEQLNDGNEESTEQELKSVIKYLEDLGENINIEKLI